MESACAAKVVIGPVSVSALTEATGAAITTIASYDGQLKVLEARAQNTPKVVRHEY